MKNTAIKSLILMTLITTLHAATPADSAPAPAPAKNANQATVLQARTGQQVELRLKSGDKISGKLVSVGDHLVHLTALTGMEMYEATVALSDISAVVVRSAAK
jgi:hypothetical protein